jgi:hypothetical protein
MKNEFVSYEIALALEELGFNEPCLIDYQIENNELFTEFHEDGITNSKLHKITDELNEDQIRFEEKLFDYSYAVPLFQQAFKWFENTYGLFVDRQTMCSVNEVMSMDYYIHSINGTWKIDLPADYSEFDSYKANTACLEKLIEIVKAQKE